MPTTIRMNASAMNHINQITSAVHNWAVRGGSHIDVWTAAKDAGFSADALADLDRIPAHAAQDVNNVRAIVTSIITRYL